MTIFLRFDLNFRFCTISLSLIENNRKSARLLEEFLHVSEILFSGQFVLSFPNQFVQFGLFLHDVVARGNTLTQEEWFPVFFLLQLFMVKLRKRTLVADCLLNGAFIMLLSWILVLFVILTIYELRHRRLWNFFLNSRFFLK